MRCVGCDVVLVRVLWKSAVLPLTRAGRGRGAALADLIIVRGTGDTGDMG